MQSEEQSFISNSGDTSESKSLAKYFKSKKKMEAEINYTSLTSQESSTDEISNVKNNLVDPKGHCFAIIDTPPIKQESLTNDISNIKNELVIKENETLPIITNKQNPESLIQDITINGGSIRWRDFS